MARRELFCQCMMSKGNLTTVGFIPANAAVVGNVLGLERGAGLDRGWRVDSVGSPVAKDEMRRLGHQHKQQRSASDTGTKTKSGRESRG